jgi:hypothetical protein
MDTKINVNGKDVTAKFAAKDANLLGVILKTENPASKAWLNFGTSLPSSLVAVITDAKNTTKTLVVEIAPNDNEAGKKVTATFAQIVAKVNLAQKIAELCTKVTGWKYDVETVGNATTGKATKSSDVDYSDL